MSRHATMNLLYSDYNETPKPKGPTRYQCRHVFTDGQRCGSPALRGANSEEDFCYFHHSTRKPVEDVPKRRRRQCRFTVRQPEDRTAIQLTLGEVLQKLANNDLDPRRAGLLLYGLQIASLNLPKRDPKADPLEPVAEVTLDPTHGPIAPIEEYHGPDGQRKGSASLFLESLYRTEPEEAAENEAPVNISDPGSATEPEVHP